MNTEHVVSPKDSSLKKGDFEMIKTLKLNQYEELNPVARRKLANTVMNSLLKEPVQHAAILPALAVFFVCVDNTASVIATHAHTGVHSRVQERAAFVAPVGGSAREAEHTGRHRRSWCC